MLMYRVLSESADSTKIFGILDGNSICFSQSFLPSFVHVLSEVLLLNVKIWEGFHSVVFSDFPPSTKDYLIILETRVECKEGISFCASSDIYFIVCIHLLIIIQCYMLG